MDPDVDRQLDTIRRGVVPGGIVTEDELRRKLERSLADREPLRVKLGVDPTAPDIHLGHTVVLRKLRQFQDLGHTAILIIGDYTAMVGDPSGRSKTRPQLTLEEVEANAATYVAQVGHILRPDRLQVVRNGDWFRRLTFLDVLRLAGKITIARLLERDDFAKRLAKADPISLHECLYCLMQAQDSVEIRADVELGGTDQTYNLLVGRDFQRDAGQEPQVCITTPILPGLDGVEKMSKSLGNHIGVTAAPPDMFGKLMSIPDNLMREYYTLLTSIPLDEVESILAGHPRDAKSRLAKEITAFYHTPEAAESAAAEFDRVFRDHALPDDIITVRVDPAIIEPTGVWIVRLIVSVGMASSTSDARRLIAQGGVTLDGTRITDVDARLKLSGGETLRVGKRRFARLVLPE
ncbi:MAG: tyrosine--tRNA ligase [Planctomycetes bacterium]|nr:tyrosine--tRNA ligase [Planctomycetota bacterium]